MGWLDTFHLQRLSDLQSPHERLHGLEKLTATPSASLKRCEMVCIRLFGSNGEGKVEDYIEDGRLLLLLLLEDELVPG